MDQTTKYKLSELSRTFRGVYAKKEYNALLLDMNVTYLQEIIRMYYERIYCMDHTNLRLF